LYKIWSLMNYQTIKHYQSMNNKHISIKKSFFRFIFVINYLKFHCQNNSLSRISPQLIKRSFIWTKTFADIHVMYSFCALSLVPTYIIYSISYVSGKNCVAHNNLYVKLRKLLFMFPIVQKVTLSDLSNAAKEKKR
jgi:hypothetical protein